MSPMVSVVLPVNSNSRHLKSSVESILSQTFDDLELIVVLHRSDRLTEDVARAFCARDSRVRVVRHDRGYLSAALNMGIAQAMSDVIARMDADDVAYPSRLATQFAVVATGQADVCGSAIDEIDEAGECIGRIKYPSTDTEIRSVMLGRNPIAHPTVMFLQAVFERAGGYRQALPKAQDYDLWHRMAESGASFHNIGFPLLAYRTPATDISACAGLWMKFNVLASASSRRTLGFDVFEINPSWWEHFALQALLAFDPGYRELVNTLRKKSRRARDYAEYRDVVAQAISVLPGRI